MTDIEQNLLRREKAKKFQTHFAEQQLWLGLPEKESKRNPQSAVPISKKAKIQQISLLYNTFMLGLNITCIEFQSELLQYLICDIWKSLVQTYPNWYCS